MTTDAPPPTRRQLRAEATAEQPIIDAARVLEADAPDEPRDLVPAASPAAPAAPIALAWVDDRRIGAPAADRPVFAAPDLITTSPRRSPWRPGILVPIGIVAGLAAVYAATTLLWPLHAVAPQVEAVAVQTVAAPAAAPAWPADGSAAVSVAGVGSLTSTGDARSIASITKVVTALMVLDRLPLAVGESGPDYAFTAADRTRYWQYRANGESALDVPVGGTLSEYQMLEGMLIGSANNYADRLASNLWANDAIFSRAATDYLSAHGIPGITIADPTGIEAENAASPEALLTLASKAMANPVVADIVGRASVELPGAGTVENTNPLLADEGVVGIKTGSLDAFNLLSAKDVTVDGTVVRLYAAVLGQPDHDTRDAASRALYTQLELELQPQPSVTAGALAGQVVTEWGDTVSIVTAADASVVLWNGGAATASSTFALGDADTEGATVGTLSVTGPLNATTVDLRLAADIPPPSPWWRLTHPLDLFGLI